MPPEERGYTQPSLPRACVRVGQYTISLLGRPKGIIALPTVSTDTPVTGQSVTVVAQSDVAGTVQVVHSIAGLESDSFDAISLVFFARTE